MEFHFGVPLSNSNFLGHSEHQERRAPTKETCMCIIYIYVCVCVWGCDMCVCFTILSKYIMIYV